jgi:hypothetical protein
MTEAQLDVAPPRWRAYVPGIELIRSYQRKWLPKDIVAGLVLSRCWCRREWRTPSWPGCRR